ncbi:MAG TPA: EAL domain-containing protein [Clostridia bacterium]|nr:EAL domain-containing protein [Clostridia bacterium]
MVNLSEKVGKRIFEEPGAVLDEKDKLKPGQASLRIAVIYMLAGSLWIFLSDKLLELLVADRAAAMEISMVKGWIFVITTGILVYFLVNSKLVRLKAAEDKLYVNYWKLIDANMELASAYYTAAESQSELRLHYEKLVENQNRLEQSEKELEYQVYHDQITGARNRLSLIKHINEITSTKSSSRIAVMIVDIDNFKYINDTLGHSFGDQLLVRVCTHLEELVGEDSSIYRFGGNGFVIVYEDFEEIPQAERLAVKVLKGFKAPIEILDSSLYITISIGIALYPEQGENMEDLLKNADIALYKAKETGKNRIVFYNKPMDEAMSERLYIEKHLRTALDNNEFELYYQPQLDLVTKKISGFEALIRWNSPELGFVSPLRFIGIAEDTHMILPIGEWVLRNACMYLKELHRQGYGELTMSVNISMVQLIQEDFAEMVLDALEKAKLDPKYLELELTESTLMESYDIMEGKLSALSQKGLSFALDDFGKGYSSLNYLSQLPISTLKIDKSFVDTIGSAGKQKSMTNLIVKLGRTIGLNVVAEGVETREQLDYLARNKCDRIQGYLFSKPIPEKAVADFLAKASRSMETGADKWDAAGI